MVIKTPGAKLCPQRKSGGCFQALEWQRRFRGQNSLRVEVKAAISCQLQDESSLYLLPSPLMWELREGDWAAQGAAWVAESRPDPEQGFGQHPQR